MEVKWLTQTPIRDARNEKFRGIPSLSNVPLAKIVGVLALIAFGLSIGQTRQRLPREVIFLFLLTAQLFATVPMSPVWKGGALQKTLDFAKVGLIVLVIVMAVN